MITQYKRSDIEKILGDGLMEFYNLKSLIADMLMVLYKAVGRNDMLDDFGKTNDLVDNIVSSALKSLFDNNKQNYAMVQSANFCVDAWVDEEEYLNIDCYYKII